MNPQSQDDIFNIVRSGERTPTSVAPLPRSPFRNDVLSGRVVLVTGGATGIGYACSEAFGHHGAKVAIMSRRSNVIEEAVARCPDVPLLSATAALSPRFPYCALRPTLLHVLALLCAAHHRLVRRLHTWWTGCGRVESTRSARLSTCATTHDVPPPSTKLSRDLGVWTFC